ncbi:MAG: hypothetical protein OEW87_02195 [Flavobacteriaceae bacterium]|nr:hypothetical protein [Flavobacteriaceae bacterium]
MTDKSRKGKQISRRGILPILGSTLLIPFLGFGNSETIEEATIAENDEEYQTLLKPDGTTVKVKVSTLKKSKVIKKNISNNSFLNWLGKKL